MPNRLTLRTYEFTEIKRIKFTQDCLNLIYIHRGRGTFQIDSDTYRYSPSNLYILAQDHFLFSPQTPSQVHLIIVPWSLIQAISHQNKNYESCNQLHRQSYLLHHRHSKTGKIFTHTQDENFAIQLINQLVYEQQHINMGSLVLINNALSMLMMLITRNMVYSDHITEESAPYRILAITSYIQENAKFPERLKQAIVAQKFGLTTSYFGKFFKQKTQTTYRDYIQKYRIELVINRLKFSSLSIKEIAVDMNYNNESHLSHNFKKMIGLSPKAYRNLYLNPSPGH